MAENSAHIHWHTRRCLKDTTKQNRPSGVEETRQLEIFVKVGMIDQTETTQSAMAGHQARSDYFLPNIVLNIAHLWEYQNIFSWQNN